ncbi:hypothetical protein C7C46_24320 [Streptomyces tateyamensis]|uniref:Uncharacterized protein n=1 Tax=Streptomyces tateyamensis TaxID=565073 RepID=A0A2V4MX58_9ACTN|nr:hypothetical protein C7C46_24320 [Streptomyces tateyamensis]
MRYAQRWERMCVRHGRWLLDADADQELEFLDVRGLPERALARRRWRVVARRAVRAGKGPGQVFAVAWAVVCRWWDQALEWEQERVWPARLHAVAGGDAGGDFWRRLGERVGASGWGSWWRRIGAVRRWRGRAWWYADAGAGLMRRRHCRS